MRAFVIDASVAIKWVINEVETPTALLLRGMKLTVPDLMVAECANILWKKVRRNELCEEEAIFAAGLIERADIDLTPTRRLIEPAVKLSLRLDHPSYDCVYIALGQSSGRMFVTADDKLCRKAHAAGLTDHVVNLARARDLIGRH